MADEGLKGAKSTLGEDGVTVVTRTDSAATAREVMARQEQHARQIEGWWGAQFNAWLDRSLKRGDETGGIFSHRAFNLLSWAFAFLDVIMQWNAWFKLLPVAGLDIVLGCFGVVLVLLVKAATARLDEAEVHNDESRRRFLQGGIVVGVILSTLAAVSLQAFISVEQATGRTDIQTRIDALRKEQNGLQMTMALPPDATAAEEQKLIDAFLLKPVVNRAGTVVVKKGYRIGEAIMGPNGACTGSSYYVTIYCPTLKEMEAARDSAKTWEEKKTRFDAIPAEIKKLEDERPKQSSTFALYQKVTNDETNWTVILIPAGISLFLTLLMIGATYLAHRSPKTKPTPAAGGQP